MMDSGEYGGRSLRVTNQTWDRIAERFWPKVVSEISATALSALRRMMSALLRTSYVPHLLSTRHMQLIFAPDRPQFTHILRW